MSPVIKYALIAVLAALVTGYFVVVAWRAPQFARILLHRGFGARGWDEEQLSRRIRLLATCGAILGAIAAAIALVRITR